MTDADPGPPVILAEMGIDAAQAVVAGRSAALLDPHLSRQQVEFVVQYHHVRRGQFVEARRRADRAARLVPVGQRLQERDALAPEPATPQLSLESLPARPDSVPPGDPVQGEES